MRCKKLIPAYKDYLWGGEKLKTEFNKKTDVSPLAESWEVSCHKNGLSRLASDSTMTLENYIRNCKEDILGENATKLEKFPILLKLIDAKDNLSIQVHPDDKYALKNEKQYGKTEAWYILSAEKGAKIIYGLKEKISRKEFRKHVENNSLMDVINEVEVKPGDLFLIEPGTLHAIGKGIVIAEIQQNSDVTYRVYDYNRKDANGNTRQLHIDKACDTLKYNNEKIERICEETENFIYEKLIDCNYFKLNKIIVKSDYLFNVTKKSFVTLLCIDGLGEIVETDGIKHIKKGDCFFFPSGHYSFSIIGDCEVLEVSV